jgi:hypothetical protein
MVEYPLGAFRACPLPHSHTLKLVGAVRFPFPSRYGKLGSSSETSMKATTPHLHVGTEGGSTLPNRTTRSVLSALSYQQWILMGTLSLVIFSIDLLTPLGIADGMLYVTVILIFGLREYNPSFPLWVAGGCSILTILGYHLSPEGGAWWEAIWNRGLSLLVIWVTAFTCRTQLLNTLNPIGHPGSTHLFGDPNARCHIETRRRRIMARKGNRPRGGPFQIPRKPSQRVPPS